MRLGHASSNFELSLGGNINSWFIWKAIKVLNLYFTFSGACYENEVFMDNKTQSEHFFDQA